MSDVAIFELTKRLTDSYGKPEYQKYKVLSPYEGAPGNSLKYFFKLILILFYLSICFLKWLRFLKLKKVGIELKFVKSIRIN